jgi:phosphohistidine phosphatase SixA
MLNSKRAIVCCALAVLATLFPCAHGQVLQGSDLTRALEGGGYVIVMRHASSPRSTPNPEERAPGNTKSERQLDQSGIEAAKQMGVALRRLDIPIGVVYSSPTFRALETIRFANLGRAVVVRELGDNGMSMTSTSVEQTSWLRKAVTHFESKKDVFIVTHMPNIVAAFPDGSAGLGDGEALMFGPDGQGGARIVARIKIDEWSRLPH